ncbi:hypothetical protein [Actinomadura macrotermitis]|uniref:Lipoprotein n=1 Tax=Actinomadura macrotermitis TaxID=2585200 RepID=A0A7K0C6A5_9ACTN|nr:hypothetical protein [Actinomadura macrotermitis]MQY08344.1 hypothetical protein [Actinomadura macrotermitis]
MRKVRALAMSIVVAATAGTAVPAAAADRREDVTRPFDVTIGVGWRSKRFPQNAGTDVFVWQCLGIAGEEYRFAVYNFRTIASPPQEVYSKVYTCVPKKGGKPNMITEKVPLDRGVYMIEFSVFEGSDGVHLKGKGTYPKQTD